MSLVTHPWDEWGDPPKPEKVHTEFVPCDDAECACDECGCDACWESNDPVRAEGQG